MALTGSQQRKIWSMEKIAVIGVGHLGEAILAGLLRAGFASDALAGTALPQERAAQLSEQYGIEVSTDPQDAARQATLVLLTIPPDQVASTARQLAPVLSEAATIVASLAAGVTTRSIEEELPTARVVRVMTNTAARTGDAMSVLCAGASAGSADLAAVRAVFDQLGTTAEAAEESMDAVTAIVGSGPAFVYYLALALEEAAQEHGLGTELGRQLVSQMMYGAATVLKQDQTPTVELIAQVATPGGTTEAGLNVLGHHSVEKLLRKAMDAAIRQAGKLAQEDR